MEGLAEEIKSRKVASPPFPYLGLAVRKKKETSESMKKRLEGKQRREER